MQYDYSKLRGKIREVCHTQSNYADALKINKVTVSQKLNNKIKFSQDEIVKTVDILGIDISDIHSYFFNVQK